MWKDFKFLSHFIQKWIQPLACSVHRFFRILSSCWLAHFYLIIKIRQSAALFWFGLRAVGILHIFYQRAVFQRKTDDSLAFLEHDLAEKIVVCAHTNRDPNKQEVGFIFVWSGSELWSLFKYSKRKLKNPKPTAVDDFLRAYPMIPLYLQIQSGRTVLLRPRTQTSFVNTLWTGTWDDSRLFCGPDLWLAGPPKNWKTCKLKENKS